MLYQVASLMNGMSCKICFLASVINSFSPRKWLLGRGHDLWPIPLDLFHLYILPKSSSWQKDQLYTPLQYTLIFTCYLLHIYFRINVPYILYNFDHLTSYNLKANIFQISLHINLSLFFYYIFTLHFIFT